MLPESNTCIYIYITIYNTPENPLDASKYEFFPKLGYPKLKVDILTGCG